LFLKYSFKCCRCIYVCVPHVVSSLQFFSCTVLYAFVICPTLVTCHTDFILSELITLTNNGCTIYEAPQHIFLSHVTSSLVGWNNLSTLFSVTIRAKGQVSVSQFRGFFCHFVVYTVSDRYHHDPTPNSKNTPSHTSATDSSTISKRHYTIYKT
jgi:hypothetical protein